MTSFNSWRGFHVLAVLLLLSAAASPCGDPITEATAGPSAHLVIQNTEGTIRIGERVFANLVLPEGSELTTGTLSRGSCNSLQLKVEPNVGWHDPWADWYNSGILDHASGGGIPTTCGVMGYLPGHRPPPQITFTLNDWIQFDRPGTYKISVAYTTYHVRPSVAYQDPYDYQHSGSWVRIETPPVEVIVAPENTDVSERADAALTYLRRRFPNDLTYPSWAIYSQSEAWKIVGSPALLPLLRNVSSTNTQQMRWIYEVAPNKARRSLSKAITAGDWKWAAGWAQAIPNTAQPSPALDRSLANGLHRQLADEEDSAARDLVVLKLGGPALIPDVHAVLSAQPCLGSPSLWSFLLKYEGKAAEKRLLERYLRVEPPNAPCETDLQFQQVLAQNLDAGWRGYWSPAVEQIVVAQLKKQSADAAVEIGASELLERFGSPASEDALWEALTRFKKSPPRRDLDASSGEPDLEHRLISGIVNAYHWYPDPADVQRLNTLCVDQCSYLKWIRHAEDPQYLIFNNDSHDPGRQYGVNGGSLSDDLQNVAEWIQRYPTGTKFAVSTYPGNWSPFPSQAEYLYPELVKTLHAGRMEYVGPDGLDEFGRCTRRAPGSN